MGRRNKPSFDEMLTKMHTDRQRAAWREQDRMGPEIAHKGAANCALAKERAPAVAAAVTEPYLSGKVRDVVANKGKPGVVGGEHEGSIKLATIGLCLLGKPELHLCWPARFAKNAHMILDDLIWEYYHDGEEQPYDGKQTCALAYDVNK